MIESFLSAAWAGGQILYWLFLRPHTELLNKQFWKAFRLRFGLELVEGES